MVCWLVGTNGLDLDWWLSELGLKGLGFRLLTSIQSPKGFGGLVMGTKVFDSAGMSEEALGQMTMGQELDLWPMQPHSKLMGLTNSTSLDNLIRTNEAILIDELIRCL